MKNSNEDFKGSISLRIKASNYELDGIGDWIIFFYKKKLFLTNHENFSIVLGFLYHITSTSNRVNTFRCDIYQNYGNHFP